MFARELGETADGVSDGLPLRIREDLCIDRYEAADGEISLSQFIMADPVRNSLRNELSILRFAIAFLRQLEQLDHSSSMVFTPGQILLREPIENDVADIRSISIKQSTTSTSGSLYAPPPWCRSEDRWRFQLGFLLRFIFSGQPDFTVASSSRRSSGKPEIYHPLKSHWYQRIYGLFNAQEAFGHDWLPISDWMELFLLMLLRWPGCRSVERFNWIKDGIPRTIKKIRMRIDSLETKRGLSSRVLMLPMSFAWDSDRSQNILRACVVQTVIPAIDEISAVDLSFSSPTVRRKHRAHLSAALAAVGRMLDLRATHYRDEKKLDWLILPELSVHPDDVDTHLVPFARKYRTLILAGLTYEELFLGQPLVNSAMWIMPEWTKAGGLRVRKRRQGKWHLAPDERQFFLQPFRPCQWLLQYPWSWNRSVVLTASVCYDATDLALTADLRTLSDVFAVPALNKDVNTFDQMAQALHYHMFQLVVVVNNGQYGGSNAHWPISDIHRRALFHLHGQRQASVGFFEIDDIADYLDRRRRSRRLAQPRRPRGWKYPPAGLETG